MQEFTVARYVVGKRGETYTIERIDGSWHSAAMGEEEAKAVLRRMNGLERAPEIEALTVPGFRERANNLADDAVKLDEIAGHDAAFVYISTAPRHVQIPYRRFRMEDPTRQTMGTHCAECRVEWPCETSKLLEIISTLLEQRSPASINPAEELGSGLRSIISRIDSMGIETYEIPSRPTLARVFKSLLDAVRLDAVKAMADAYPDDPFYAQRYAETKEEGGK